MTTFETSIGRKLDIDNLYPSFGPWAKAYVSRWQWDIAGGRMPMISWSPRVGSSGCATFADIVAGKYDSQLAEQSIQVKDLSGTVWLRLFFEPDMDAQLCANPTQSASLYVSAYRHIVNIFRSDGATNVRWVWAPGQSLYASGLLPLWYPGADVVDVVGEDTYQATGAPKPFSADVCQIGPQMGKPFAITETGALSAEQPTWLGNVKSACPGLTAFVYFDAPGTEGYDYDLTDIADFVAIGK